MFLSFTFFAALILGCLFPLKRFLRIPLLLFLFLLFAVPFIKDLFWLLATMKLSIWGWYLASKWPWPIA